MDAGSPLRIYQVQKCDAAEMRSMQRRTTPYGRTRGYYKTQPLFNAVFQGCHVRSTRNSIIYQVPAPFDRLGGIVVFGLKAYMSNTAAQCVRLHRCLVLARELQCPQAHRSPYISIAAPPPIPVRQPRPRHPPSGGSASAIPKCPHASPPNRCLADPRRPPPLRQVPAGLLPRWPLGHTSTLSPPAPMPMPTLSGLELPPA
ncbi:hypothetical protein GGR56DRAFT_328307 [Xylariaceae sp. FL0804]|nr:hypothetical protein GGR56DRAFT_328307 [Xylariaceae sp. FL0804]